MMSGSKAPDFDAYGLFRAAHSHNPPQYSHIVGLSSTFMLISGRSQGLSPTYEQAHVGLDLLTWHHRIYHGCLCAVQAVV